MLQNLFALILVATAFAVPRPIPHASRDLQNERIVNGTDVPRGKYPSMVIYEWFDLHMCSGTILNENWVLTAAHCVDDDTPDLVTIISGTVHLSRGGTRHNVSEIIMHEDYLSSSYFNDVAVVRVDPPFVWDANTQPVTLPAQGQDSPGGSNATVVGWGYADSEAYRPMEHLQEASYWVVSDEECQDIHYNTVYSSNICAYYPGGGKGQCSGDSGGPLFVNGYQAGIVSWSVKPCAVAPYPGVFTEVSAYVDWIESKIN